MRILTLLSATIVFFTLSAFKGTKSLVVTSPAFAENTPIPIKYTCNGYEFSPPINIANIPAGAVSLAIIVDDPDVVTTTYTQKPGPKKSRHKKPGPAAPGGDPQLEAVHTPGCFTHWIIWNIDPDSKSIPENFVNDNQGMNGNNKLGWWPICPPTGTHHYHFKVYALDTKLNVPQKTDRAALEKVMEGHILSWGELVGTFNKDYK